MVKTPKFVSGIFPKRIWAFPNTTQKVYLTFDDGPIPEVTPWVLEQLAIYDAKATFFCIGDNLKKYPDIAKTILAAGHCLGNHTFHHINGWKNNVSTYIEDVDVCQQQLDSHFLPQTKLFRPPFGRLKIKQAKALYRKGYKVIMWSVLSKDYDATISEVKCLQNVCNHIQPGSIVVFHDSLKASNNLKYTLPKVLAYCKEKGWECAAI